jgi:hypothetical protein
VEFQVRRGLGLQTRHPNFLSLSGIEASADQNEVNGVGTRNVDGVRPQERALNGAQENKALPVAQRRPGDPVVNDCDDRSLLLGRSRPDAERQQGERGHKQARQGRGREHYLPTLPRFARHDASLILGLPRPRHHIGTPHRAPPRTVADFLVTPPPPSPPLPALEPRVSYFSGELEVVHRFLCVGHGHIGGHVEPVARSDRSSLPLLALRDMVRDAHEGRF